MAFDWSGTIIDDRELVYETIGRLLRTHNKSIMPFNEWISFVSSQPSSLILSEFIFEKYGIEYDVAELGKVYTKALSEVVTDGVKSASYPDALDIFHYLAEKGKKIAVVSFQPNDHILKEANEHGLSQFITRIIGDAFDKTSHLIYLCKELNIAPSNALFVGDMVGDIQAAKMAGIKSAAITTGYHSRIPLLAEKPDFIISNLSELKNLM